jgi:hypothetical protein
VSLRAAAFRAVLRPPVLTRSLWVALVVGTLLNLINQGDRLAAGAAPEWGKLGLTFAVPFFVASFGAWSALAAKAQD